MGGLFLTPLAITFPAYPSGLEGAQRQGRRLMGTQAEGEGRGCTKQPDPDLCMPLVQVGTASSSEEEEEEAVTEREGMHHYEQQRRKIVADQKATLGGVVLRSKGFAWVATMNDTAVDWGAAGVVMQVSQAGAWFCTVDEVSVAPLSPHLPPFFAFWRGLSCVGSMGGTKWHHPCPLLPASPGLFTPPPSPACRASGRMSPKFVPRSGPTSTLRIPRWATGARRLSSSDKG